MIGEGVVDWVKRGPPSLVLSLLFSVWFGLQLLVLAVYGPEFAKWIFYTELPPTWPPSTFDPGYLLSPISHDMFDFTHLTGNIAFLLLVGGLLEPYVNRWKIVGLVIIGSYVGMVVTMATSPVHQFWPIAGASTGIMILWGYTGPRMWYELDLRHRFPGETTEEIVASLVLLAVPAIPLYEVFFNGNMSHAIGIGLGVLYFLLERIS